MVRRPLLLILSAFIIGGLIFNVSILVFALLLIFLTAAILVFLIKKSKNRHDQVLLIVPVFCFLGCILMRNQNQPGPMDSKIPMGDSISITISGSIHSIQTTSSSYKLLLSNVQYDHAEGQSKYVLVYTKDVTGYAIGNRLNVTGELSRFQKPTNEYQFDEALYYKEQNIDYKMMAEQCTVISTKVQPLSNTLYQLRGRFLGILSNISDEEVRESLSAMLLGEKSQMEEETKSLYELGGIAHIISISGLHVALVGMVVFSLLQYVFGLKSGVVGGVCFIICYGILTNFSVSTNRAAVMLILFLLAKIAGRTYDMITAIALSGLLILLKTPMQMYQCGFLLSYGAVIGISVIYPCFLQVIDLETIKQGREWKEKERGPLAKAIRKGYLMLRYYIVVSFLYQTAILLVTLPILLFFYYKIATYSFFLNLIVLPLMTYVVLFGLAGVAIGAVCLPLGKLFLLPAVYVIRIYLGLCRIVQCLPKNMLVAGRPQIWKILIYILLVTIGCVGIFKRYRFAVVAPLAAIILLFFPRYERLLKITSVDVGQGDCTIVQTPGRHVFLIDGGSSSAGKVGEYRILPYLWGLGIDTIDEVFATHADEDHISAIKELIDASSQGKIRIGRLVLSNTSFEDVHYEELVVFATERNVPVCVMERGQDMNLGEVQVECLHPKYQFMPEDANDYSLVLSIRYRQFSMLCTGDLSMKGEEEMMRNGEVSPYDVLKVGHHGSKNSSSDTFLQSVQPRIALISCGVKNRYGHPHKETIERLAKAQATVYQTRNSGMIRIETDGEIINVSPYCK